MSGPGDADALALAEEAARREAREAARQEAREADAAARARVEPSTGPGAPAAGPTVTGRIEGAQADLRQGVIGGIAADRVTIAQGIVGGVMASDVRIDRGVVGGVLAERVSVVQGGAARIVGSDISIEQGGGGLIAGWNVRLGRDSFAAAVVAPRVEGEVRALLDWRGVLAASVAIVGIAWLLRRR